MNGRPLLCCLLLVCVSWVASVEAAEPPVSFGRDVLPILSDHCFHCHGPDAKSRKGNLRLDTAEGALRQQEPVIVPKQSGASSLVERITSGDAEAVMPPPSAKRPLTPKQIDTLRRWIDQGATWGKHWAFESPVRPALPVVKQNDWPRNPIDYFVLARLEQENLTPAPSAERETLIRRVTLDLNGLGPTLAEVDAFLKQSVAEKSGEKPSAYDHLVARLLSSPHYGQRMAWDWLDAARYADSNGYQGDPERTMWPWRDWVVRAINANMPYDQFTIEQLAGDLLPGATNDQIIATGFNRNHMFNGEGGRIAEETRIENVMDRVETTSTIWLGLTMTCARCHDHKYDALTQREYYQLFAYFNNTSETGGASGGGRSGQISPTVEYISPEDKSRRDALKAEIERLATVVIEREKTVFPRAKDQKIAATEKGKQLPDKARLQIDRRPQERDKDGRNELASYFKDKEADYAKELLAVNGALDKLDSFERSITRVMVMDELKQPRETFMLAKGAYNKPTDKVSAGVPAALNPLSTNESNNRLALARWLVDKRNPLMARVTVNRFWQLFFGTGLVKTVEDFGVQGEKPSHGELLDWLACELVDSGWDVKHLHRLIVSSATYRQSSKLGQGVWERDPDNRLLARGPRYRLPAWMLRDQALAVSGLLVDTFDGPSVRPYQPAGVWEEATFGKKTYTQDHGAALYRRSLYTFWRRIVGPTMFFDNAARQTCTVKGVRTNTPLHALTTLNDTTFVEAARALAQRVMHETGGPSDDERITHVYRLCLSRTPSTRELTILRLRLETLRKQYAAHVEEAAKLLAVGESPRDSKLDPVEHAALANVCLLVLNLDETLSKE